MKIKLLILLFLFMMPLIFADGTYDKWYDKYDGAVDYNDMFSCYKFYYDNSSRDLSAKVTIKMDTGDDTVTTRDCVNGLYGKRTYKRQYWLKETDLVNWRNEFIRYSGSQQAFLLSNDGEWSKVFTPPDPEESIFQPLDQVRLNPSVINDVNDKLANPVSDRTLLDADRMAYYYALAEEKIDSYSFNFYNGVSDSFYNVASDRGLNYFHTMIVGSYGSSLGDFLTNPDLLKKAGIQDGTGAYSFLGTQADDSIRNTYDAAYFVFTDDLNYYYYPYYIVDAAIIIEGYDSPGGNRTFWKYVYLEPTSNVVYINPATSGIDAAGNPIGNAYLYDVPNLGTQLIQDKVIASIPEGVNHIEVSTRSRFKRNSLYRLRTPVDNTWYHNDVFESSISGGDAPFIYWNWRDGNVNITTIDETQAGLPTHTDDNTSEQSDFGDEPSNSSNTDSVDGGLIPNGTSIPWGSDPAEGGGLTSQKVSAELKSKLVNKQTFFTKLIAVETIIVSFVLVVYLLFSILMTGFVFFVLMPGAYRKALKEMRRLMDFKVT